MANPKATSETLASMTSGRPSNALTLYGSAFIVGLAAVACMMPWATISGTGGLWVRPSGDAAVGLTGHLAYQAPGWHWPLLLAQDIAFPQGRSIAMTDSNPVMSIAAKLMAATVGHRVNLLGCWLALCWVLQAPAALFAFRALAGWLGSPARWEASCTVIVLSMLCPAWLARIHHLNLFGHFLLLAALGLALRHRPSRAQSWWPACALLLLAVLVHPYLYLFCAIALTTPVINEGLQHRAMPWRTLFLYVGSSVFPVLVFLLLDGSGSGASPLGFGYYSMNLLSPIWPQHSGLFGADLPVIDATGGQYEGFNYLGFGVLLLIAAALVVGRRRSNTPHRPTQPAMLALALPMIALTLLALSPHIYAGSFMILAVPLQPWRTIFAAFQSSGRAFWLVGYVLMLASILVISRLRRSARASLFVAAIVLQFIDTAPIRASAYGFLSGAAQPQPPFGMPKGASLLRIVPACETSGRSTDLLRLLAVRAGMRLADMRMARTPKGYDCETALSDGLEGRLAAGELRFFLRPASQAFRMAALGDDAMCGLVGGGVLCAAPGLLPADLPPVSPGAVIPTLPDPPALLRGAAAAPFLSTGWRADGRGDFWSEGPTMTLLFRTPSNLAPGSRLALQLEGISSRPSGERTIRFNVNDGPVRSLDLPDLVTELVTLPLPATNANPVRVVFGVRRPVDPAGRDLNAPARRTAIKLLSMGVQTGGAADQETSGGPGQRPE